MSQRIQAAQLRAKVARIIEQAGSAPAEAAQVADNLVMANLSGHDSHGVGMVPRYVDAVLEGGLSPNTGVKVLLDTGPLLNLDGQRGYGQITGVQAMQMGIDRAKQHGVCTVALSRSHHQFELTVGSKLLAEGFHVIPNGVDRDVEVGGNGGDRHRPGQTLEHLELARCQFVTEIIVVGSGQAVGVPVESVVHCPHGVDQVGGRRLPRDVAGDSQPSNPVRVRRRHDQQYEWHLTPDDVPG